MNNFPTKSKIYILRVVIKELVLSAGVLINSFVYHKDNFSIPATDFPLNHSDRDVFQVVNH